MADSGWGGGGVRYEEVKPIVSYLSSFFRTQIQDLMAIFMVHPNLFYPKFVPPLFYIAHGTYLPLPEDCNICVGLWIRIHFFADPDPALILNADPDPPLKTCKK